MKNHHPFICCLLTGLLSAALVLIIYLSPTAAPVLEPLCPTLRKNAQLVIDPGHGGEDGGAVSSGRMAESHINLSIALRCSPISGLFGIPVSLTRETDISLGQDLGDTVRQRKRADLAARAEYANAIPNSWLMSIHQNHFTSSSYCGAQVFYRPTPESQSWATFLQHALHDHLSPANERTCKEIPDTIYLMSHVNCPAILVECGFLSHPTEAQLLTDPTYQTKLAVILVGSFLSYQTSESH